MKRVFPQKGDARRDRDSHLLSDPKNGFASVGRVRTPIWRSLVSRNTACDRLRMFRTTSRCFQI
jgi:hypothetical protein